MKKALLTVLIVSTLLLSAATVLAIGNGWRGYNWNANVFVGTCEQWCEQKFGESADCDSYCGSSYVNDLLVMKWNEEWNRGNAEGWSNPPYNAWEDNEWNGNVAGGSGEVWHYKIIWVGPELEESPYWREGGYAIWGQFEVIMDQGTDAEHVHEFLTKAIPAGYGT